jgi:hypothetical protein
MIWEKVVKRDITGKRDGKHFDWTGNWTGQNGEAQEVSRTGRETGKE